MERAGVAAFHVARTMAGERGGSVVVLAGPGNNGGDAFVVARLLREAFFDVIVVFRGNPAKLPADAAAAYRAFVAAGGTAVADIPSGWDGALIVDGLFGIGLARPLAAEYATLVKWVNASERPILALDVPSGLDADTGVAVGPVIRAHATATFIALKPGMLTGDGVDLCGAVSVHALGLDAEAHRTRPRTSARLEFARCDPAARARPWRAQRPQGNLRHARHRRWRRRHGRRAAPRRTRGVARRRGKGVDRFRCRRPSNDRLEPARADVANGEEGAACRRRRARLRPGARRRARSRKAWWTKRSRGECLSCSMPMRSTRSPRVGRAAAAVASAQRADAR